MKHLKAVSLALCLALFVCVILSACNPGDSGYPVTVGHTTFTEKPQKVVSLSDNITDIICYTGHAHTLSGVSDQCTQAEVTEYITSVGDEASPNYELIINSNADVVFVDSPLNSAIEEKLEAQGIKVVKLLYPKDKSQLKTLYSTICTILDGDSGKETGVTLYERLISVLETAEYGVTAHADNKTMCYLYLNDSLELCSYTGAVGDAMVLDYLGVSNVAQNFEDGKVNESNLSRANPDYIFFDNAAVMDYLQSGTLKSLKALSQGNVFELNKDELNRYGESIINVQNFMLSCMFPELIDNNTPSTVEDLSSMYSITLTDDMMFKKGDENDAIYAIQQRLVDLGFLDLTGYDNPTNYFGGLSEQALKDFQTANGLEASGIASYETLKRLFSSDALGKDGEPYIPEESTQPSTEATEESTTAPQSNYSEGVPFEINEDTAYKWPNDHENIKYIQLRLIELGYLDWDSANVTTYFHPDVEKAIMNFQVKNGIIVDSTANYTTLTLLFSDEAVSAN